VSLAGPIANLGLAIIFASPFYLGFIEPGTDDPRWNAMAFLVVLQMLAMVFNLIPVPGLDGFGAIAAWMDEGLRQRIYQYSNMMFFGLILIVWNVDGANQLLWNTVFGLGNLLGVPTEMAYTGLQEFRIF
jgi:Zn-dependent protease